MWGSWGVDLQALSKAKRKVIVFENGCLQWDGAPVQPCVSLVIVLCTDDTVRTMYRTVFSYRGKT